MRDILLKLLQLDGGPEITLFSIWHIMYIVIIIGLTISLAFILKGRSEKIKNRVLSIVAIAAIATYIADFFIMPLARYNGDPTRQLIDIDKLPFHICTFISIMVPFAQFKAKNSSKVGQSFREVVACLAIVSSLMYVTYPGSALGGVGTFSYKVVQTFVFHGLVFSWGFLSLTTGSISLSFKNIWKQAVGILVIILWAAYGNNVYSSEARSFDWFFITGSTFPFVPTWLMPIVVLVAVFAMCAIIYSIDLVTKIIIKKCKKTNKVENSKPEEKTE